MNSVKPSKINVQVIEKGERLQGINTLMMGSPILFLSSAPQMCRISAVSMKCKFTTPSYISISIYCSLDRRNNKDLALTAPFCFILKFSFQHYFHFAVLCIKALIFSKVLQKFPRCRN